MEQYLRKFDYKDVVESKYKVDTGIGEDIRIFDNYSLDPIYDYDFVSGSNTIIYIKKGHGTVSIDGNEHEVQSPCILVYFNGQKVLTNIQSEVLQWSMDISDRFLNDLNMNALKFNDIKVSLLQNPVIPVNDDLSVSLELYEQALINFAFHPSIEQRLLCAKYLTLALFYGPMYMYLKKKAESATFRSPKITSDFFSILDKSYKIEHNLSFYAGKLSISEKYLYLSLVSATGKSPRYWIEYHLFVEAKRLLSDRELSIQQVADELHFSSSSSFGKFFLRLSGMSPSKYRDEMTKI